MFGYSTHSTDSPDFGLNSALFVKFARRAGALTLIFGLMAAGCDKSEPADSAEAESASDEKSSAGQGNARFDDSYKEKQCELLTAEMVAEIFKVPADELEQKQVRPGYPCEYSWKGEDKELTAELGSIDVYDSVEKAAKRFTEATKNVDEAQAKEAMAQIKKQAEESGELESDTQKEAAGKLGEGLTAGGFAFEKIEGLGDQAVYDLKSAQTKVRVDNLIFNTAAYFGEPMERPETTDLQAMLGAVSKFQQDTRTEREAQSKSLAEAIIKKL